MALNPIRPRLRNISNSVAKVQISVAPGDELEVSDDVAAQLAHQGAPFRPPGEDRPLAEPSASEDDLTPEPAAPEAPEPVQRTKKRPAKKLS